MVKAIGIAGSPRREGNSTMLLDAALKGAASAGARVALIRLNDLTFRGCQACEPCAPDGDCILRDDLAPVFAALRLADVWILASPIYRDGLSGQFKSFFDRCCCWEGRNRLPGTRRAAMIVAYADKEEGPGSTIAYKYSPTQVKTIENVEITDREFGHKQADEESYVKCPFIASRIR